MTIQTFVDSFRAKKGDANASKPLSDKAIKVRIQTGGEEIEYHGGLAVVSNRMAPERQDAVEAALKALDGARRQAEAAALAAFDKALNEAKAARDAAIAAARSEFDVKARDAIINGAGGQ